jgi:hypothetical protein
LLGIAYEFDPYFGLSISRVDPLPHQLEAVYDHLLKLPRVRFLLADDAGAGKTIMAGLLIRELKLRGLAERTLIVCPANLTFQWQRELKEKFDEEFEVLRGENIRDQYGINQWLKNKQVLTSLDLAKRDEILPGLKQGHWDLVIVDEAHRMSWTPPSRKTARYALGEILRDSSDHFLLLTATPHKGDPENFSLFLQLLDEDVSADIRSIRQAIEQRRAPFYLRRTKEAMVYFPERQAGGSWTARKIFTTPLRCPSSSGSGHPCTSTKQTRGTLAMLAQGISWAYRDGYKRARREPLITLGSAPLDVAEFRATVLGQLGETRLESAITTDIAGDMARARALDADAKGALREIHRRVGATILFESSGGMVDRYAHLPELRFALGEPEVDTTSVDNAAIVLEKAGF